MVGFIYGGDGECSWDGVNGKSGSFKGRSGMVGASFVSWDISTFIWTRS